MALRDKIVFDPPEIGCVLSLTGLPGGGSYIYDRSLYGNVGSIIGATLVWQNGLWCLSLDGNDDYVTVPHQSSLNITTAVTIELWFKVSRKDVLGAGTDDQALLMRD